LLKFSDYAGISGVYFWCIGKLVSSEKRKNVIDFFCFHRTRKRIMPHGMASPVAYREDNTLILPIDQEQYERIFPLPAQFRVWIDEQYRLPPEIFSEGFNGVLRKDLQTKSLNK
jgi:UDP:flavonoid glycosyltransferase YjiC (YdhE family)